MKVHYRETQTFNFEFKMFYFENTFSLFESQRYEIHIDLDNHVTLGFLLKECIL